MATRADRAMAKLAVAKGFCTKAQAQQGLQIVDTLETVGRAKPLHEVLQERGLVTPEQAHLLGNDPLRVRVKCRKCGATSQIEVRGAEAPRCPDCHTSFGGAGGSERRSRTQAADSAGEGLVGQTVANYQVMEKLGGGGMGAVYKAKHLGLDREVALKILSPNLAQAGKAYLERFLREAQAVARLKHRNIVAVYNVGSDQDRHFIEMEFVDGQSLEGLLAGTKRVPIPVATRIVRDAAKALQLAHENDIIHRDVKPGNIMMTSQGEVKVADFGLAKSLAEPGLTGAGRILGTPLYMAPEQAAGLAAPQADIYSLGAVYYELLTGSPPFIAATATELLDMHAHESPPPPEARNPEVSAEVSSVVLKMLEKKPNQRYQRAFDVVVELNKLLGESHLCLVRILGGEQNRLIPLTDDIVTIGRVKSNAIVLAEAQVSSRHAQIRPALGGYQISDLDSRHGTFVNGKKVTETELRAGDVISIGTSLLAVVNPASAESCDETAGGDGDALFGLTCAEGAPADTTFPVSRRPFLIGRHEANAIRLDEETVSEFHAQIVPTPAGLEVFDLKSAAGVLVNGKKVLKGQLGIGDALQLGGCQFQVHAAGDTPRKAVRDEGPVAPIERIAPEPLVSDITSDHEADLSATPAAPPDDLIPTPGASGVLAGALSDEAARVDSEFGVSGKLAAIQSPGSGAPVFVSCISGPIQGKCFRLTEALFLVGSGPECNPRVHDQDLDEKHAQISWAPEGARVRDLGTRRGTYINGRKVSTATAKIGDRIVVGSSVFLVHA